MSLYCQSCDKSVLTNTVLVEEHLVKVCRTNGSDERSFQERTEEHLCWACALERFQQTVVGAR